MHLPNHSQFIVVLQQPRRQPASTSALFGAWRELWRCAPRAVRRDTVAGTALVLVAAALFAAAWGMLPA